MTVIFQIFSAVKTTDFGLVRSVRVGVEIIFSEKSWTFFGHHLWKQHHELTHELSVEWIVCTNDDTNQSRGSDDRTQKVELVRKALEELDEDRQGDVVVVTEPGIIALDFGTLRWLGDVGAVFLSWFLLVADLSFKNALLKMSGNNAKTEEKNSVSLSDKPSSPPLVLFRLFIYILQFI